MVLACDLSLLTDDYTALMQATASRLRAADAALLTVTREHRDPERLIHG